MLRFAPAFAVLVLLAASPVFSESASVDSAHGDDTYRAELTGVLTDWLAFADANGYSVVESEIFKIEDDDGYNHEIKLKPGFYTVWAQPDSRYRLNSASIWVSTDTDEYLAGSYWDDPPGSVTRADFTNPVDQKVNIKLYVYRLLREGAFAAYILVYTDELTVASRENYVRQEMEKELISAANDNNQVIDIGYATLDLENREWTNEYQLESGRYEVIAFPGTLIWNIDLQVVNEDGEVLTQPPNAYYHSVYFSVENSIKIAVKITATEFADNSPEDYFLWIVNRIGDYEGY